MLLVVSTPADPGLDLLTNLDTTEIFNDEEAQFYNENPLLAVLTPYLDNQRNFIHGSTVGVVLLKDTANGRCLPENSPDQTTIPL